MALKENMSEKFSKNKVKIQKWELMVPMSFASCIIHNIPLSIYQRSWGIGPMLYMSLVFSFCFDVWLSKKHHFKTCLCKKNHCMIASESEQLCQPVSRDCSVSSGMIILFSRDTTNYSYYIVSLALSASFFYQGIYLSWQAINSSILCRIC